MPPYPQLVSCTVWLPDPVVLRCMWYKTSIFYCCRDTTGHHTVHTNESLVLEYGCLLFVATLLVENDLHRQSISHTVIKAPHIDHLQIG